MGKEGEWNGSFVLIEWWKGKGKKKKKKSLKILYCKTRKEKIYVYT